VNTLFAGWSDNFVYAATAVIALAFLAHAAGLAAPDDPAAPVLGGRVLARGQEFVVDRQRPAGYRMRLIDRVRQALVA